jgi:Mg2+/Co2+ transporter CorB
LHLTSILIATLISLLITSGFFSASETSMMAINRYRLRHLTKKNHRAALRTQHLLERPDRLLGVILIGNTFANIIASSVGTLLAINLYGEVAVLPATLLLALIILIFAEIVPKTVAAFYPERLALSTSGILSVLLKTLYPLVWCANGISNGFLRLFNIRIDKKGTDELTNEEVRTLVHETTGQLSLGYRHMMLGVLDLGGMTVSDIKVPRNDIVGIDLDEDWQSILDKLANAEHTRLPIYTDSIDQMQGILHLRKALNIAAKGQLTRENLQNYIEEAYFIPEATPLNIQLLNFRKEKRRIGLIVDEYGDIQGLVTLEDILEEIVGEFTTNLTPSYKNIRRQKDGSYLINGGVSIRELNRRLHWELPIGGPNTLNGLIVEYLEIIPDSSVCVRLAGHVMEIIEMEDNTIKTVRVWPHAKEPSKERHE